jgi:hypothetical protein
MIDPINPQVLTITHPMAILVSEYFSVAVGSCACDSRGCGAVFVIEEDGGGGDGADAPGAEGDPARGFAARVEHTAVLGRFHAAAGLLVKRVRLFVSAFTDTMPLPAALSVMTPGAMVPMLRRGTGFGCSMRRAAAVCCVSPY